MCGNIATLVLGPVHKEPVTMEMDGTNYRKEKRKLLLRSNFQLWHVIWSLNPQKLSVMNLKMRMIICLLVK